MALPGGMTAAASCAQNIGARRLMSCTLAQSSGVSAPKRFWLRSPH